MESRCDIASESHILTTTLFKMKRFADYSEISERRIVTKGDFVRCERSKWENLITNRGSISFAVFFIFFSFSFFCILHETTRDASLTRLISS